MKRARIGTVIVALLAVAACSGTSDSTGSSSPSPSGTSQKIAWRSCGGGFQCGTIQVPLDYSRPGGRRLRLAVIRLPASGKRTGSLVTNPGGPGGSGVDFVREAARNFGPNIRQSFDIVGFDPRGVGQSSPQVRCLGGRTLDRFFATDTSPDNQSELNTLVTESRQWAGDCQAKMAALLPYVGTRNAARDIDVLRAALGDQGLTYYGASYGTYLGAYYADQFPTRVRALVLDGAIDPRLSGDETNIEQGVGFDTAAKSFAADCVTSQDCPLGTSSTSAALDRLAKLFSDADRKPLRNDLGDGRQVDEALAELGVAAALYSKQTWPVLKLALRSAIDQGDGTTLLRLGDTLVERRQNGTYSNQSESNMAVNCVDKPYSTSLATWQKTADKAKRAAPMFGQFVVWGALPCAYWPVRAAEQPHALTAPGAKPIVVIGTTRDPATPYKWAQNLAGELKSGRLLTLDGDGHTAYLQGNPCITEAVDRYILSGTPPKNGTRCR